MTGIAHEAEFGHFSISTNTSHAAMDSSRDSKGRDNGRPRGTGLNTVIPGSTLMAGR